ncbi:hypothetical protein G7054_g8856 [Neopestalotiopsis clavispora]|nr:hypothetical protein G7054_g8856 [Neopestalotiopsis clavispora]
MPDDYEGKFKVNEWNAMQLKSFYSGPNGYHWALKHNREWAARCPKDMVPFLHTQLTVVGSNGLASLGRGHVTFVSFVPDGTGWFARYSSNQCMYGPDISAFPSTWKVLVHELEQNHPRKDECIDFAAFGQHELLLVRFENGNSQMVLPEDLAVRSRISAELVREVEERLADGWTFGNRTTLCGFDTRRWFIEWIRGSSAIFRYNTGDGEKSKEDLERVKSVLSGVGSDAALVASHNNAHLIAANSAFAQQLAVSRWL